VMMHFPEMESPFDFHVMNVGERVWKENFKL
jgi:hypothetical protein